MRIHHRAYLWKTAAASPARLREIADLWLAKNPKLKSLLKDALKIAPLVEQTGSNTYDVPSDTGPAIYKVVIQPAQKKSFCDCPAKQFGKENCKHRLAVALIYTAERSRPKAVAPSVGRERPWVSIEEVIDERMPIYLR
jgi:hypothetical protein